MPERRSIPPLPPGTRLDDFELLHLLNSGGQAQIYLARVVRPPQPPIDQVARQVVSGRATPEYIAEQRLFVIKLAMPGSEENLRDEHLYLLSQQFQHQRLLPLFDTSGESTTERRRGLRGLGYLRTDPASGRRLELPYITLPYLPGGSLKDLIQRRGHEPFPPPAAVCIAGQIGAGVQHLHERMGLVHQDISPSNILLRARLSALRRQVPDCVLIDFAVADSPRNSKLRAPYGKKIYQPPERFTSPPSPIDWSVDVYSLGMLLYELLAGRPRQPSPRGPAAPLPIQQLAPQLSAPLASLVMAALSPRPTHRPTMAAFNQQLARLPEAAADAAIRLPWRAAS